MDELFLIVGLGNPGREYVATRHNAGFLLADRLAERWRCGWTEERKFRARVGRAERGGRKVILCEPQTFMNASGEAVGAVAEYFKVPAARVLVMVDDADLPLGEIRMRRSGSSGGHHGLESIEQHLGTNEFARLRVGIGRRAAAGRQITGYVLENFAESERELLGKILERATGQVECWLDAGIEKAMNQFNGAVSVEQKKTE